MESAAQRERAYKSLASNTRFGPQKMAAVSRVLEIMDGVIFFHLIVGVVTRDSGVEEDILLDLRWRNIQSREYFVQSSGFPEAFLPLFWVVNVSVMNVAD